VYLYWPHDGNTAPHRSITSSGLRRFQFLSASWKINKCILQCLDACRKDYWRHTAGPSSLSSCPWLIAPAVHSPWPGSDQVSRRNKQADSSTCRHIRCATKHGHIWPHKIGRTAWTATNITVIACSYNNSKKYISKNDGQRANYASSQLYWLRTTEHNYTTGAISKPLSQ